VKEKKEKEERKVSAKRIFFIGVGGLGLLIGVTKEKLGLFKTKRIG